MAKSSNRGEGKPARTPGRRRTATAAQGGPSSAAAGTASAADSTASEPSASRPRTASNDAPGREDVARRAYELYLERGGRHGHDLEDWFEAERQLQAGRRKGRSKA